VADFVTQLQVDSSGLKSGSCVLAMIFTLSVQPKLLK